MVWREGCEVKITEAILKEKPVIVYRAGGMPQQIEDGVSGYLVKPGDTNTVADYMYKLSTDQGEYRRMSENAARLAQTKNYEFTTVPNTLNWLYLFNQLVRNPDFRGNGRYVRELALAA